MTVAYLTPLSLSSSFFVPFSRSKKWSACTRENASRRCVLYIFCLFQRRNTSTWKQLFESSFSDFVCRWNLGNVNLEFFKNNLRSKRNLGSRVYQGFSRANSFTFVRVEHGQGWALLRSLSLSLSLSLVRRLQISIFILSCLFFFLSFFLSAFIREDHLHAVSLACRLFSRPRNHARRPRAKWRFISRVRLESCGKPDRSERSSKSLDYF